MKERKEKKEPEDKGNSWFNERGDDWFFMAYKLFVGYLKAKDFRL